MLLDEKDFTFTLVEQHRSDIVNNALQIFFKIIESIENPHFHGA